MRLAIRADGGPKAGYGHLVRTGTLAKESLQNGDDVFYFTQTPDPVQETISNKITTVKLDSQNEAEEVAQYIEKYSIDVLFTDSFAVDTRYQKRLSETNVTLGVRHNFKHYTACCDVLVFGDLHAADLEYGWVGSKPEFCLGPEYILLREEFQQIAEADSVWNETPTRALIVMGGSDVNNMTPSIMDGFSQFNGCVDVVIGPGYSNANEIQQRATTIDTDFNLLHTPENMAAIMERADVAVSAVGGTAFELLATRTPFVGIPQVDNQKQRAAALQNRGLALVVTDGKKVGEQINNILSNDVRAKLYQHIEGVIDGKGAKRVYDRLIESVDDVERGW